MVPESPLWKRTRSGPAFRFAWSIASRRLPAPLASRFVTVKSAAWAPPVATRVAPSTAPAPAAVLLPIRFALRRRSRELMHYLPSSELPFSLNPPRFAGRPPTGAETYRLARRKGIPAFQAIGRADVRAAEWVASCGGRQ